MEVEVGLVLEGGAEKYGIFNWRNEPISITTYVGAIRRHVNAILDGEDIDPESGRPHWAHIAASAGIAMDAKAIGNLIDDRPTPGAGPELMESVAQARKVIGEHTVGDVRKQHVRGLARANDEYIKSLNSHYGEEEFGCRPDSYKEEIKDGIERSDGSIPHADRPA
jgi:hypothetical protein